MRSGSVHRSKDFHSSDPLNCYLREIRAYPLLDHPEELDLSERARAGDRNAMERLVCANLRFVVSVAKKFQNQGVPLSDLINEGNLGLVRAAEKYDGKRGVKFVSYAVWWIRRAIMQALADHGRAVRVPIDRSGAFHRIRRRTNVMCQELGREPTPHEIATELHISEDEVETSRLILRESLSLDAPLDFGERGKLLDSLPAELDSEQEKQAEEARAASLEQAMGCLRPRDEQVLRLYFGFGYNEPLTLEDIGAQLGITRERVRQIKERALSRLRKLAQAPKLASLKDC
jgi:RNA polymerase primary sigma factor